MSEKKKPEFQKVEISPSGALSLNLDIEKLNNMSSGSCIITSSEISSPEAPPDRVAVCKEGKTIKIYKIIEEKK